MTNLGGREQPRPNQSFGAQSFAAPSGAGAANVPAEHVVARMRRHGRILFWPTLVLIAVAGLTSYFVGQLPEEWESVALLTGAAVLVVLAFVFPLLSWLNRRYTITTRRVIVRHGFFVRVRQEILHSRGYTVTMRRSWVQSAFRTADIVIAAGGDQVIVLRDIPNADLVQRTLHELMESNQGLLAARMAAEQQADDHTIAWGQR